MNVTVNWGWVFIAFLIVVMTIGFNRKKQKSYKRFKFNPIPTIELTKRAIKNHPEVPALIVYSNRKDLVELQSFLVTLGKELVFVQKTTDAINMQPGQVMAMSKARACCGFTMPRPVIIACICVLTPDQNLQIFHRVRHSDGPTAFITPRFVNGRYCA